MIPQAIANTGPYAGLWSDLKSMRHALDRAMKANTRSDLCELDQARLRSLLEFFRAQLNPGAASENDAPSLDSAEAKYSLDIDLRQMLRDLPVFDQWHRSGKLGFKEKSLRLIASLEEYLDKVSNNLFPKNPPEDEFKILHSILSELLLRTEVTLLT